MFKSFMKWSLSGFCLENERICWSSPLQVIVIEILLAFGLIVKQKEEFRSSALQKCDVFIDLFKEVLFLASSHS